MMQKRDIASVGAGIALIGAQLATLYKILSVEENVSQNNEAIQQIQESNEETKEIVEQLSKKVERVEKIVTYRTQAKLNVSEREFHCLAKNIFHEAGVEPRAGKIAVAQITLNRLKTKRWGSNVCDVVYAEAQFSWTLDKKKRWSQPHGKLWEESVEVANEFVNGKRLKGLESSHFYHTDYIKQPRWAKGMTKVKKVGQHIFYRNV